MIAKIKIKSQQKMVKNGAKMFMIASLPYLIFLVMFMLNLILFLFFKSYDFKIMEKWNVYLKASIFTMSIFISLFLYNSFRLISSGYFLNIKTNKSTEFFKTLKLLKIKYYWSSFLSSIIKTFLCFAWMGVFYVPTVAVGALLYYATLKKYEPKILITLFACDLILFLIATIVFLINNIRYSFLNETMILTGETDSLKIINMSISKADGKMIKYAKLKLSFIGWIFVSLAIIPIFYVLPYIKIAKATFFNECEKTTINKNQTPVIFYFKNREKTRIIT